MAAFARVAERSRVGTHSFSMALGVLAVAVMASFSVVAAVPGSLSDLGGRGENSTARGQILDDLQTHGRAMGQASAEPILIGSGTARADLQPGRPQVRQAPSVQVTQGGVARWADKAAVDCGFHGKRYPAVDAVCYYPIDLHAKAGMHEIALYDRDGEQHLGALKVEAVEFPEVEIKLPDDTFVKLSEANMKRHQDERARVLKALKVTPTAARFSLPLGKPAAKVPASENDFGSRRLFNGTQRSQHTGRDAPVSAGSAVNAVADGTVLLAEEQFFTGNSVFVDHGGGLVSMNFHLGELNVAAGDEVKRGQTLGIVGSTGRSTGPHMHLGIRWMGARIDPFLLLDAPTKLPTIGDAAPKAEAKIDAAQAKEPTETDGG
ncbi:MAG: M23 family metallopeptidase [Pseudomarimonas sp.]